MFFLSAFQFALIFVCERSFSIYPVNKNQMPVAFPATVAAVYGSVAFVTRDFASGRLNGTLSVLIFAVLS